MNDYKITDYNHILSSIGNAYFSGLTFNDLWNCVLVSDNREELDVAISTSIKLKEMTKEKEK
jgi:hypothetical protein